MEAGGRQEPVEVTANVGQAMKLNILSDLHLSLGALQLPENDGDVVILAGDVARPKTNPR